MKGLQIKAILTGLLCLAFMISSVQAADYKDWIPMLPESIGGQQKVGEPSGANMESNGKSWSTIEQKYSDGSGESVTLTIVSGIVAPQVQQFQSMQQFSMETENKLVETLQVSGNDAVLELYKDGGKGTLLVAPRQTTLVIIETSSAESKEELISLADDVPFYDFSATAE